MPVADPSQPLLTYYDMSTGERVELSTTTTANWVAKTSNFLVDELDAEPGTRIRIGLPSHWLTTVWILSAWNVGAAVVDAGADIGLSGPELVGDEPHKRRGVACDRSADASRRRPRDSSTSAPRCPGTATTSSPWIRPVPRALALDLDGSARTHADVLAGARPDPTRTVVAPGPLSRDVSLVVDACLGGGSLVIVASATPEQIARVARQEGGEVRLGRIHYTRRGRRGPQTRGLTV